MFNLKCTLLLLFLGTQSAWSHEIECSNLDRNGTPVLGAFYVGAYKGADNLLSSDIFNKDFFCAERFITEKYQSKKFLTIFGSSSIKEAGDTSRYNGANNNKIYQQTYDFASKWSKTHPEYPVLTGAGPGLMEAAARGAMAGSGVSIGYTTYYKDSAKNNDAATAYWRPLDGVDKGKQIISDGLIFSSVSARETIMILHSAAAIFVPGGSGTNWEIFQTLEMLKSNQLSEIPVYMLGDSVHWATYQSYVNDMVARGALKESERENFIRFVRTPEELMNILEEDPRLF